MEHLYLFNEQELLKGTYYKTIKTTSQTYTLEPWKKSQYSSVECLDWTEPPVAEREDIFFSLKVHSGTAIHIRRDEMLHPCHESRGKIHQAFWLCFCILQAIKNWSRGRPGNEARVLIECTVVRQWNTWSPSFFQLQRQRQERWRKELLLLTTSPKMQFTYIYKT